MANSNKVTKMDMFVAIKGIATEMGRTDIADFCTHEMELLEKKSAAKKPNEENIGIKALIKSVLDANGSPLTITEIQKIDGTLGGYSNQKISSLMSQMVKDGEVVKTIDKKVSRFSLA